VWLRTYALDIHSHITLHHSICIHKHSFIAFVFLSGCFGKKKKWSFMFRYVQKRKKLRQKEEVVFYASLCTKRREGVFSPSAQNTDFVHIKAPQ
jgi:hypothetical protein